MNPRYRLVARRASHRCEYCRAPEGVFNFPFEVEHVVPVARGGSDDTSNLALSCRSCNARKGGATTGRDDRAGGEMPLFDPREQRWTDHFTADPDSLEIVGRTPVGRATVNRLDLNHPTQLAARVVWSRLGLFP